MGGRREPVGGKWPIKWPSGGGMLRVESKLACVLNCEQAEKQQRIIYSGRLLQDDVQLKDVLRQVCVRCPSSFCLQHVLVLSKGKGSPYSITERRVPELIPVLGSQPAGDVSHKPTGWLPLLSARPAVTLITLKRAATNFAA